MLSKKMLTALNNQINAEMYSSFLYLSMAVDFESKNLSGMGAWMKVQAKEEYGHAMKILHYVIERGSKPKLAAIEAPKASWETPLAAFEDAAKHEKKITGMINKLVDLAAAEKDHATSSMLKWFVDEQVEEEATADDIVEKLKMIKGFVGGLFMLDSKLGQREG